MTIADQVAESKNFVFHSTSAIIADAAKVNNFMRKQWQSLMMERMRLWLNFGHPSTVQALYI